MLCTNKRRKKSQSDGGQGWGVQGALCCLLWSCARGMEADAVFCRSGRGPCAPLSAVGPAPPVPFPAPQLCTRRAERAGTMGGFYFFFFKYFFTFFYNKSICRGQMLPQANSLWGQPVQLRDAGALALSAGGSEGKWGGRLNWQGWDCCRGAGLTQCSPWWLLCR